MGILFAHDCVDGAENLHVELDRKTAPASHFQEHIWSRACRVSQLSCRHAGAQFQKFIKPVLDPNPGKLLTASVR